MSFKTPERILIVRTDRLGDLILSTPVIKNIKMQFPSAELSFMCSSYARQALLANPYLVEIIVCDKGGFKDWLKLVLYLRKRKFDWAIILHPTVRVHLLTFFAGIPRRIGWDRKKGWLLTDRIKHNKQEGLKHELEYNLDILRYLDIPIRDKSLYFPLFPEAWASVKVLPQAQGLIIGEYIVINPLASCPSKRWPQEYFSQLIKLLKDKFKLPIVIISSKAEAHFADLLVRENQVIDLRGKLDLLALGALLKNAKLFISNDSGPVHIAAAFNTPVISIFGRNDRGLSPTRWRPVNEKSVYIHKNVGCDKCLAHACKKEFLCLKAIKPEEVFQKAIDLISPK